MSSTIAEDKPPVQNKTPTDPNNGTGAAKDPTPKSRPEVATASLDANTVEDGATKNPNGDLPEPGKPLERSAEPGPTTPPQPTKSEHPVPK
jgi:hypothetical protein